MKLSAADSQLLDDLLTSPAEHWHRFIDRYASVVSQVVQHCWQTQKWPLTPPDAEEIIVAVFQQLAADNLALIRRFDRQGSLSTYLTVAARRIALQELHDRTAQQRLQSALVDDSSQRLQIPGTAA